VVAKAKNDCHNRKQVYGCLRCEKACEKVDPVIAKTAAVQQSSAKQKKESVLYRHVRLNNS
jgi:CO dehydrogenase/acetyl-CoA synthase alpha subunit